MPSFDVTIHAGPVLNHAQEVMLTRIAEDIDRNHAESCLLCIIDEQAVFDIQIVGYDSASAELTAKYMLRDRLLAHQFPDVWSDPSEFKTTSKQVAP